MTMLFMDSFDHYTTIAQMGQKWTSCNTLGTSVGAFGRNGTNGFQITNDSGFARKVFPVAMTTIIVGFAYRVGQLPVIENYIARFFDAGTEQVSLRMNTTGKLVASRAGTALGTGTTVLAPTTYNYIEVKVTISNTVGVFEVRINGVTELNLTGIDTQMTANATVDTFGFEDIWNATQTQWRDDLYICDTLGANNNAFLGDLRIQAILPSGAGTTTQWTPSAGANYTTVDEATPNDDTDYVSSATVNQIDTYAFGNVTPATGAVKAIQIVPYARKDDAGTRTIAPMIRTGGVDYVQANLPNLTTSYNYLPQVGELNPGTGVAWTITEINAAEFGAKMIA